MASGRAADREDPVNSKRKAARSLDRDPISELPQGQRSDAPHQRAGHMTAPDHFAKAELNIFRRRGPSTYDLSDFVLDADAKAAKCVVVGAFVLCQRFLFAFL
jgi:hypothetical protein